MDLAPALARILCAAPERAPIDGPIDSLDAWWSRHREAAAGFDAPIARALVAGAAADRPGYAFASGLQEALAQLLGAPADRRRALCATEEGGAHPRAIAATLRPLADAAGWRLDGSKRWSTLACVADELLVVARLPAPADAPRPSLVAVRVPADRRGITIEATPPAPFVPEIPHAAVALADVRVAADERLPGDGYARYLKPFRTVEDCFVHAALVAWVIQVGRHSDWPKGHIEDLAGLAVGFAGVAAADPRAAGVHLALAGLLERSAELLSDARSPWDRVDATTRARWLRDRGLLAVASRARARRLEVARATCS